MTHRMQWRIALAAGLLGVGGVVHAQGAATAAAIRLKQVRAVRIDSHLGVRIDGKLNDAAWERGVWVSEFTQREPVEGAAPSQRTEVAFLYNDEALYVGARMFSDSATEVRALVTRRDQESTSEQLVVSLDTHHDRRTAYSFAVTAAGVRLDYFHPSDRESKRDYFFEPVWTAKTAIDAHGWTAELRIPFSQLRFNRCEAPRTPVVLASAGAAVAIAGPDHSDGALAGHCLWGVNLTRRIPARNEEDYLVLVRRTETGWASRFAELVGIDNPRPSRRIEVVPYVASEVTLLGQPDLSNPFVRRNDFGGRTGADLKAGLGPSLTLDATINPDFAQVEADPAEVNLTEFETVFPERRPFFVEGSQLLSGGGITYFHPRRIGQAPHRRAPGDYAERPTSTTILGAGKVTGRLPSGLSVGILSAVTARESARTFDQTEGTFGAAEVEPLTAFGVVRLQQEHRRSGSTVGFIATAVERDVAPGEPLGQLLSRRAYAGALDWNLRFHQGAYVLSGTAGGSAVAGDSLAVLRIQRASAHYFQRPDARRVRIDPSRTSLYGHHLSGTFEKLSGRWLWNATAYGRAPGLEINDAGRLSSADEWGLSGGVQFRQTKPSAHFHRWDVGVDYDQQWNYDGVEQVNYVSASYNVTGKNFWSGGLSLGLNAAVLSDNLTRGGPLMGRPRRWDSGIYIGSSPGRKTRWKASASYVGDEAGGQSGSLGVGLSVRPGTQWELSADPYYSHGIGSRQYYTSLTGGPVATYGVRYVFAFIERSELSTRLRLNYALKPDLTLEVYGEPFASSGRYYQFGELPAARSLHLRTYGADGTTLTRFGRDSMVVTDGASRFTLPFQDFNALSFRSNLVLRWEWRPGSTAYLVWQQNRSAERATGALVRPRDLGEALTARGDNVLAVKVSYWMPVR